MKKRYSLLFIILAAAGVHGQTSYFDQLAEVNQEWLFKAATFQTFQNEPSKELNDREAIAAHLHEVQNYLLEHTPAHLTEMQKSRRHELLCGLTPYYSEDWFPVNLSLPERNPIFIDQDDRFCAVGYLMKTSGREALAREIAKEQNYAYVKDIKHPELESWATWAGFTTEELAWIQPGYPPQAYIGSLEGGVNGPVYSIVQDFSGGVLVGGDFTMFNDSIPSAYLAHWISGFPGFSWLPVPNNLPSPVHALYNYNNGYLVGGDFMYHGDTTSVYFLDASGNMNPMGILGGEVRQFIEYNDSLYAVGRFDSNPPGGNQYGMAVWNGTDWHVRMGGCNGRVEAAIEYMGDLVVGGSFTEAQSHVRKFDGQQFSSMGNTPIKATVYDFEITGGKLFAAGDLVDGTNPVDTFGMAEFLGGEWQTLPIAQFFDPSDTTQFFDLQTFNNQMIIGGNFKYFPFTGFFSENLVRFDAVNSQFEGIAMTSGPVHSLFNSFNSSVYFGGDFHLANTTLANNIAFSDFNLFSLNESKPEPIKVYPNPAVNILKMDWPQDIESAKIKIQNMSGQVVQEQEIMREEEVSISALPGGYYLLHFSTANGLQIAPFNKLH